MLRLENFVVDLNNGMNLEEIQRNYKVDNNKLKELLVEYSKDINIDNEEEFLFYEQEGNFNILKQLGFSNLIV